MGVANVAHTWQMKYFRLVDLVKDAGYLIRHPYTLLKSLTTGAAAGVLVFLVTSIVRNTCMVAMRAGGLPFLNS